MKEEIEFTKWCFTNHKYVYDLREDTWFHIKSFKTYTWDEIYDHYIKLTKLKNEQKNL